MRVLYKDIDADNEIEFTIRMTPKNTEFIRPMSFNEYWGNGIKISGKNEEWVRSRYDKINRVISSWKNQCEIFNKYDSWLSFIFIAFWSTIIGGAEYLILIHFNLVEHWLFPAIIGFFIALILAFYTDGKLEKLFPSIELLTGPNHLHFEDEKRKKINWFIITILIPFIFVIIGLILTLIVKV